MNNTENKGQQDQNKQSQGSGGGMNDNRSQGDSKIMSAPTSTSGTQTHNANRGNFANDPERAREAGRKGGQS